RRAIAGALDAVGEFPEAADNYNLLAEALCASEKFEEAAEAAARAAFLIPGDPTTYERLANLYILSNIEKEAASAWLKVIKIIEESGDKTKALAKVEYALKDLPLNEDLNRALARLLLESGESKRAIAVYERLTSIYMDRGDTSAAINAIRAILKIDSSRNDMQERLKRLQMTKTEIRQQRKTTMTAIVFGVLIIGGIAILAVTEFITRSKVNAAIEKANQLVSESKNASPVSKKEMLSQAISILTKAGEHFTLLGLSETERVDLLLKLNNDLETVEVKADNLREQHKLIVQDWLRLRNTSSPESVESLKKLRELTTEKFRTTEVEQAIALVKEYDEKIVERKSGVKSMLDTIKDKTLPPEKRFEAFSELNEKYPEALSLPYPEGASGLTVPVKVSPVSNTGAILKADIFIGKDRWPTRAPCLVEIPVDRGVQVKIRARGFGDKNNDTVLATDKIKSSVRQTLERSVKWTHAIRGTIESFPAISPDAKTVFAATSAGELFAVESKTGRQIWPTGGKLTFNRDAIYKLRLGMMENSLLALSENGIATAFNPANGTVIWPKENSANPIEGIIASGYTFSDPNSMLLITSQMKSPVYALNSKTGELVWPKSEAQTAALMEKIGSAAGNPFVYNRNIFLMSTDGKLHMILSGGTYTSGVQLIKEPVEGQSIIFADEKGALKVLIAEETVGIHCFEAESIAPLKMKKLWTNTSFTDQPIDAPFLLNGGHVFVGFGSGRIGRLDMKDGAGSNLWDYQETPGAITGRMVIASDRLLVPFAGRSGRPGGLLAIRFSRNKFEETEWRFDAGRVAIVSGVSALRDKNGEGVISFAADNTLYCLDIEEER
ncbi:MAG: PQQ-like beta-propeller repeat protein, partial [Planctomycetes bacterium]|nr:PQQ-like beta-propeller repeat protein [Planctomycetota bacterium]